MVGDHKPLGLSHRLLTQFDLGVIELLYPSAVQAHHVVMVLPFVEFINRLATFEMVATEDASLLELQEHPIDRGQTDVGVVAQQNAEHVFGCHVPLLAALKYFQDFQTRQRGLQTIVFQFVDLGHVKGVWVGQGAAGTKLPLQCFDHIGQSSTMTAPLRFSVTAARWIMLFMCTSMAACTSMPGLTRDTLRPYVAEVVQGNFVSKEQRQAISTGMVRAQVQDILGTPLLTSLFHADRWDYAFSIRRQGVVPQNFQLTIFFKNDAVSAVEGDDLPSESEFAERLVVQRKTASVPNLQASEEALKKFPPPKAADDVPRTAPLPATYPPLEPTLR
jgi:outer membrane protein assembly factor BamE